MMYVVTYSINDYTLRLYFSHRESRVFLEVLEPQELRDFLVKREIGADLDLMEMQYEHIYHLYNIAIITVSYIITLMYIIMNGQRICGALVQFGCYQCRHERM